MSSTKTAYTDSKIQILDASVIDDIQLMDSKEKNHVITEFENRDIALTMPYTENVAAEDNHGKGDDAEVKMYIQDDFENLPPKEDRFSTLLLDFKHDVSVKYDQHQYYVKLYIGIIIFGLFLVFFIYFMICKTADGTLFTLESNITLIWLGCVLFLFLIYKIIEAILVWKDVKFDAFLRYQFSFEKYKSLTFKIVIGVMCLLLASYIIFASIKNSPYNLASFVGLLCLIGISYLISTDPNMINWRTVLLALFLQFILAFFILTTRPGYNVVKYIGDMIYMLIRLSNYGTTVLFGSTFNNLYAFMIFPMTIFLSSLISVLYYLEVIQVFILVFGTIMQKFIGTTCAESLNAAANIFLGMTQSLLLIKPFLGLMTNSELHAVMTAGFATTTITLRDALLELKVSPHHLLAASVLSAPAALAISKIVYPETKKSITTKDDAKIFPKSPYNNIIEAATAGATESISLIAAIIANTIAFMSFMALFNQILRWIGERLYLRETLSLKVISSYLFWPISFLLGVHVSDCEKVAELIGIKIFVNELIGFQQLGIYIKNKRRDPVTDEPNRERIDRGTMSKTDILNLDRSAVIGTYAISGFASFTSIGIMLGTLTVMIPHRHTDLSGMVIRAMIAGIIASFMTACIAGIFYQEHNSFNF